MAEEEMITLPKSEVQGLKKVLGAIFIVVLTTFIYIAVTV